MNIRNYVFFVENYNYFDSLSNTRCFRIKKLKKNTTICAIVLLIK